MTLLLALLLSPFVLLTCCFAVEMFAGLRPLSQASVDAAAGVAAVIIVPAHDEESIMGPRLAALQLAAADVARIMVVADNCTDSTASIARRLGVDVVERFDSVLRGKGFALDFARQSLGSSPPDVVLIVDADCEINAESIRRLVARCSATGRPCQAVNLQHAVLDGSPAVQLSTFAFFIKNVVRQRALQRIARRVHLLGTGMALPWRIFSKADLATANIAEDMKLGLDVAEGGHPALFVEDAEIWSSPETQKNTLAQRRRWEGGFLQNAFREGPRMLARGLRRAEPAAIWAALDVLIPPFALLLLVDFAALMFSLLVVGFTRASLMPTAILGCSMLLAGIGLIFAWVCGGSRFVTVAGLARAPAYILWKLPMYLGFARRGAPKEWLRTRGGKP